VLRLEYSPQRLLELARERGRALGPTLQAWCKLWTFEGAGAVESNIVLHWDGVAGAYCVELWETLEPPSGNAHDYRGLPLMGRDAPITRVPALIPQLTDIKALRGIEFAVREADRQFPTSRATQDPQWDNNFARTIQAPNTQDPSSGQNTVDVKNYLLDF